MYASERGHASWANGLLVQEERNTKEQRLTLAGARCTTTYCLSVPVSVRFVACATYMPHAKHPPYSCGSGGMNCSFMLPASPPCCSSSCPSIVSYDL